MSLFFIGFCFAVAEHLIRALIGHSFRFQPQKMAASIVVELPAFMSFAFVAGAGAEWIGDTSANHSAQIIFAIFAWLACLWAGAAIKHDLWWLRSFVANDQWSKWKIGVRIVAFFIILLSCCPYLVWTDEIGVARSRVVLCSMGLAFVYLMFVRWWSSNESDWRLSKCKEDASTLLSDYVKKSPHGGTAVFEHPSAHLGHDPDYYISKYQVAYCELMASKQCLCIEEKLSERLAQSHRIAISAARRLLREAAVLIVSNCDKEYFSLAYVVGDDTGHERAKDIIKKAGLSLILKELDQMRKGVETAQRFIQIEAR